jgi:hypothetical protein
MALMIFLNIAEDYSMGRMEGAARTTASVKNSGFVEFDGY